MNFVTKARLIAHFAKWRFTWNRRNTHYRFTVSDNPRFMSPRDAVRLIPDGAVMWVSGFAGSCRPSIIAWAMRELYEETDHPRDLTFIGISALGGRDIIPGTMEEVGLDGLCTRLITGHAETFKAHLRLADAGKLDLYCMPQGAMAFILASMAEGKGNSYVTDTGIGTCADPRVGNGGAVCCRNGDTLATPEDGRLRFTLPQIDVAIFNAPAADRKGNIYMKNAVLQAEHYEVAKAARKNGGTVIANVGLLVEEGYDDVFLPAEDIDAVVYYPDTEQTGSVPHRKHWPMLTLDSDMQAEEGIERIHFINRLIGVTPRRTPVDNVMARLAAQVFAEQAHKGVVVDVGVGLPEEVSRLLHKSGAIDDVVLFTESGVFGGIPAPGLYFGTAVNPTEIVSSAEAFRRMYEQLDAAILGVLQADSDGNVNVSKRGEGAINYVGPGGFIDITTCAELIVFVGTWMAHAEMKLENGGLRIVKPGKPKFVEQVDEITFSGKEAVKLGKRVFYVTNVGVFRLTERGMELIQVMPGIDVQKDIVEATPMRVVLPEDGHVPVVPSSIMTGKGFNLTIAD